MTTTKKIKTYNTNEFLGAYFTPDLKLTQSASTDYGQFFIARVQELVKSSQFPVPPTRASTHTLLFITSGAATLKVGFHKTVIRKNECLIVPAGQVLSYDKREVNEGFICAFGNDFLLGKIGSNDLLKGFEFLTIWGNPIIKLHNTTAKYVALLFERMMGEYTKNGLKNSTLIQSAFITALCELQHTYKPLANGANKAAITLTNKFKALLRQHIRTHHRVSDYASMLHVSPNHLNKSIKEVTQKPITKWIDETLILEAKVLLFQTNNSINEIASEIGINDQSYFSRLFKKYEGVTPLEYRKKIEIS